MKTEKLSAVIMHSIALAMIMILASCNQPKRAQSNVSEETDSIAQTNPNAGVATRSPDGKTRMMLVDIGATYQSILEKEGVKDFSDESLMKLITNENEIIRTYSILLLGEKKVIPAIPTLEEKLNDESYYVKKAATKALLNMGNRKGIPVLEELCEKYSKEAKEGNYRNLTNLLGASGVLADAGEVSAIPYLRQLARYKGEYSWGIRLSALRSLGKLNEKDTSVLTDIESMRNDEHPQVRKEATEIKARLQSEK